MRANEPGKVMTLRGTILSVFLTFTALPVAQSVGADDKLLDLIGGTKRHYNLNIEETMLSDALRSIALTTGANIIFSPSRLQRVETKKLNGHFTIREALTMLLEGTDLEVLASKNDTYIIASSIRRPSP